MKWIFFLIVLSILVMWFQNQRIPKTVGLLEGRLQPCPWTPNCVSSEATKAIHQIDPLSYTSENDLDEIAAFLKNHYQAEVVTQTPDYLHVVVTTPVWRFNDDLEFLVDRKEGIISLRSASRVGYSDQGMNRKRIERLRQGR